MAHGLGTGLPPLVWLALATGCVLPTDRSEDLNVVILNETTELVAGDTLVLTAELRDADGQVVPSATIDFRADDAAVGIVDSTGTFRAIGTGNTTIVARAVEFEDAVPDSATFSVLAALDITDIRPRTARFGDVISIWGFGLDPSRITGVTIGGVAAAIQGFASVNPIDPSSFDTLRVWVPAPAAALSDVVIRRGGAAGRRTIAVTQEDLFEPNEEAPAILPVPFHNPALAVEADSGTIDWYRLQLDATQSLTFKFAASGDSIPTPVVFGVLNPLVSLDSGPSWVVGWASSFSEEVPDRGVLVCNGLTVLLPSDLSRDSAIIALRDVPAGNIDLAATILDSSLTIPARYGISIEEGYVSDLPPDSREEDDYCDLASEISFPLEDALTIDNPGDVDWFRFTVDSLPLHVTFAVATSGNADIDLALFKDIIEPDPVTEGLFEVARAAGPQSTDSLSASLAPGDYLLLAWNRERGPADYTLRFGTQDLEPMQWTVSATVSAELRGVWASAAQGFAVGLEGKWVQFDAGSIGVFGLSGQALQGVWGAAPNDVWAVGTGGVLFRYDGTSWASQQSGTPASLHGVWGLTSEDVYAVGNNGTLLHFNGTLWAAQTTGVTTSLTGVWGSAPADVFAVGAAGTILHSDGVAWTTQASGTPLVLNDVWGIGANDVFAVGDAGTILHYDGTSWSPQTSPTTEHLTGLWGAGGGELVAVGANGTILHFDGAEWTLTDPVTTEDLWDVWSDGARAIAVGSGVILHGNR